MKRAATLLLFLLAAAGARAADIEAVSVEQSSFTFSWGPSYRPSLSADGQVIAFETNNIFTPDDTGSNRDVYLFNRKTKSFRRVPPKMTGSSNGGAEINSGGRYVVYQSYPQTISHSTAPRVSDIFLYDSVRNTNTLITSPRGGAVNDGEALLPAVNGTGRFITFTSNAAQLSPAVKKVIRQVYLFDRYQSSLELISQSADGRPANRSCAEPRVSENGRYVAYKSAATNLGAGLPPESLVFHLYVLDRWEWTLTRIDAPERGFDSNAWIAGEYDMDDSGDTVVFDARQRKVGEPMKSLESTDLFVFDRKSGKVERMTKGMFELKSHSPCVSGDGNFVAFVFRGSKEEQGGKGGIVIHDRAQKAWRRVATGTCARPAFAKGGGAVAFESDDRDIFPGAKETVSNIFLAANPFKTAVQTEPKLEAAPAPQPQPQPQPEPQEAPKPETEPLPQPE